MPMVNALILYKKNGGTKMHLKFSKCAIFLLLSFHVRSNENQPHTLKADAFHHHKTSYLFGLSSNHYLAYVLTAS